ncbi:MAG: hypothetical protein A3C13_02575 [Candidatus Lloydbacteria bacterium RIFCSPHIGHO2_02_FULL_50_11]|nr:MAG: hypothetical protein A3C13_02575 [Candidatus Lloydbacteria bacterium RIFCSPHIGHO2_02_FULL_50_11]
MGKKNYQSSRTFVQNLETELRTTQQKLDKLVSAYLDGDIEKEIYLEKKEGLMKQKMSLLKQKEDFGPKRKNWVEPLREWIKSSSEAEIKTKCQNYHELKQSVEKIGTNRLLLSRKVQMDFSEPWRFTASRKAGRGDAEGRSPKATSHENLTCLEWSAWHDDVRTRFEHKDTEFLELMDNIKKLKAMVEAAGYMDAPLPPGACAPESNTDKEAAEDAL